MALREELKTETVIAKEVWISIYRNFYKWNPRPSALDGWNAVLPELSAGPFPHWSPYETARLMCETSRIFLLKERQTTEANYKMRPKQPGKKMDCLKAQQVSLIIGRELEQPTFSLRFSLFTLTSQVIFYSPDTKAVWPGARRDRENIKLPVACKGKFSVCICQTDMWGENQDG